MIVRVQDKDGRGPWRPGFSNLWVDPLRVNFFPPIYSDLSKEKFEKIKLKAHSDGLHIGCAVWSGKPKEWFNDYERDRLLSFGFNLVCADICKQLATTQSQKLIGSQFPLAWLSKIEWPS